jgi:hypothetical protein
MLVSEWEGFGIALLLKRIGFGVMAAHMNFMSDHVCIIEA